MRLVVTGTHGQLAQSLREVGAKLGITVISLGRPQLDLQDHREIAEVLRVSGADIIVSAAAYTAVDKAENEPEIAYAVNAYGAGAVAKAAADLDLPIIHVSTDYVFSGLKVDPYLEDDYPAPVSVYGSSKLIGEYEVAAANPNSLILRTSWVYSPFGSNFLKTMLRLSETRDLISVIDDQFGRPTSALDIAEAIASIAIRLNSDEDIALRGVFHFAGQGDATWADFAEHILQGQLARSCKKTEVLRISSDQYPTAARRPTNSRLSSEKLRRIYGINSPDWRISTNTVLDRIFSMHKGS